MKEKHLITDKIRQLRDKLAFSRFKLSLFLYGSLFITSALLLIFLEGVFRFGDALRWFISIGFLVGVVLSALITLLKFRKAKSAQNPDYSDEEIARTIGKGDSTIKDKLLNALQLIRLPDDKNYSPELIEMSISEIGSSVSQIKTGDYIDKNREKRSKIGFITAVLTAGMIFFISPGTLREAAFRLAMPNREFSHPVPFTLDVQPGDVEVVKGDSVNLAALASGTSIPHDWKVEITENGIAESFKIEADSSYKIHLSYPAVSASFSYRFTATEPNILKSWGSYKSENYTVTVIERPTVQKLLIRLDYPEYSGLQTQIAEGNISEISALAGTGAFVTIESNKRLAFAEITFSTIGPVSLKTEGNRAHGRFVISESDNFYFSLRDTQGVSNLDPVQFKLVALRDAYPVISILEQKDTYDLNASMLIPLRIRIDDDFGISSAGIAFRILDDFSPDSSFKTIPISLPRLKKNSLELPYMFDLSLFELVPRDVVEYFAFSYDNDMYSGPKYAKSRTYRARFPTMAELYQRLEENTYEADVIAEDVLDEAKEIRQAMVEISEELKKNPELNWSKKQKIDETLQRQKELEEKIKSITEKLDEIIKEGEENQLFTSETLEMYLELQNLFQELASPELLEAMERLRDAMSSLREEDIAMALQEFMISQDRFARELERTLEIFRRVQTEQKMDEILKRMNELVKAQQKITDQTKSLRKEDVADLKELSKEEKNVSDELSKLADEMKKLEELTEPYPEMPTSRISGLRSEMESGELPGLLQEAQQSMDQGDLSASNKYAESAQSEMEAMLSKLTALKEEMRRKQLEEVLAGFQKIIRKAIQLSKNQEELGENSEGLKSNSPEIDKIASKQEQFRRDLSGMVEDLVDLSKKTFGINPSIARSIGKTSGAMSDAVRNLSERNIRKSTRSQQIALGGLNETILSLRGAMSQLSASGSGTGFEQYMRQLQQMANAQGGINNESLNLLPGSNPGTGGMRDAMRRLAARQEQLQRSLEKMMKEMAGKSDAPGRLDAIVNDMEQVVNELKNRRFSRNTIQRQQRILSRMLDSQKSMREREKSNKRKSKGAVDITRLGPQGLPEDLGERGELLNRELINALREGYARDYQELIRNYFNSLRINETKSGVDDSG